MAKGNPKREKVEPGIYRRTDAQGRDVFEISWRDAQGHQRRKRVRVGGITAACTALKAAHVARDRREPAPADPRLKFNKAADLWWEARATKLRPATQDMYSNSLRHLRPYFGNSRLSDISAAAVAAFVSSQQRNGLKGWTVKGQLSRCR